MGCILWRFWFCSASRSIRTDEGFVYLALISDMWSRKIAGDTLEAEGAVKALRMAVAGLPEGARPVHHSDRGCQYCCHAYVDELNKHCSGVSMTEEMHCYENALAERVNGIMKQEYGLGGTFRNMKTTMSFVKKRSFPKVFWVRLIFGVTQTMTPILPIFLVSMISQVLKF